MQELSVQQVEDVNGGFVGELIAAVFVAGAVYGFIKEILA